MPPSFHLFKLMDPPISYRMGFVHTSGESSRENEALATPDFSCQPINPRPDQVKYVTSFCVTNLQQSTPISYEQLFQTHPSFSIHKISKFPQVNNFGSTTNPTDLSNLPSSHESTWHTWETNAIDLLSLVSRPKEKQTLYQPITLLEEVTLLEELGNPALLEEIMAGVTKFTEDKAALAMPPTPLHCTPAPELSKVLLFAH